MGNQFRAPLQQQRATGTLPNLVAIVLVFAKVNYAN
jgi:hypothetical protein